MKKLSELDTQNFPKDCLNPIDNLTLVKDGFLAASPARYNTSPEKPISDIIGLCRNMRQLTFSIYCFWRYFWTKIKEFNFGVSNSNI